MKQFYILVLTALKDLLNNKFAFSVSKKEFKTSARTISYIVLAMFLFFKGYDLYADGSNYLHSLSSLIERTTADNSIEEVEEPILSSDNVTNIEVINKEDNKTSEAEADDVCIVEVNGNSYSKTGNNAVTITQPGTTYGFEFDIYTMDNSFNLNINGTDLAVDELQFQSSRTTGINVQFQDGDAYETDTSRIWEMTGSASAPLIRVSIDPNGTVSLFGSKTSGGPLFPLELYRGNAFNTMPWNKKTDNTVIISQEVQGPTYITGSARGWDLCDPKFSLEKIGTFNDTDNSGYADPGETITYAFKVTNIGNVPLTNIQITDPKATVSGGPLASLAVNASDSTTFTATYTVTQSDIDYGSVSNQATVTGVDTEGNTITDTSDDPSDDTDVDLDNNEEPDDVTVTDFTGSYSSIDLVKTGTFNDANSNGYADAGETITYAFTVVNSGNLTLKNISITDPLVSVPGTLASLAVNASDSTTFTATYTITQADIDSGSVTNQATATATYPDGNSVSDLSDDSADTTNVDTEGDGEPDDKTVINLSSSPSMSLEKTATFNDANNNGYADAGETITYGFKVTNTGNVTLTGISISDALVSVTGSLASLAPGTSDSTTFTATYTITQSDIDSGSVSNQATATGSNPAGDSVTDTSDDPTDATNVDPNGDGEPDDATVTNFSSSPSMSLEKTSTFNDANSNSYADVGETITYGFKVTNTGNVTLTGISISDALVSVSGTLASLAPGASDSTTFTATYTITQADVDKGSVTNQATVKGEDPAGESVTDTSDDPTDATNVDANGDGEPDDKTVTDFNDAPSSVSLEKTSTFNDTNSNSYADVGETITYGFKVTNTGNVTLTNISITDPLVSVTGSLASLAPGASDSTTFTATYTITQADVDKGSVTNQATVKGEDPAGESVTDTSDDPTDATNVDANGDGEPDDKTVTDFNDAPSGISLEKTGTFNDANSNGYADVGETITYGFKVTNTGNVTLTNISITDALVSVSGSLASLAPGASDSTTFTATYTITQTDVDKGSVSNQATATGSNPAGESVTDLSDDPTDATNVDANGDGEPDDKTVTDFNDAPSSISLEKTGTFNDANGNGFADVGETITYGFKVTNTGNLTLTNISITDPLVSVSGSLASLAPGASDSTTFTATYTITQADVDKGSVSNQATVKGSDSKGKSVTDTSDDPSDATNVDDNRDGEPDDITVTDFTDSPSSVSLEKTGTFNDANGNGFADVGETITYGFKVTNIGNVTLTGISITDPLVSVTGSLASLAPGASDSTTFTATYTITQADVDKGSVTNQATVKGEDPAGDIVSDLSDDPTDATNVDANGDGEPDDATVTDFTDSPSSVSLEKTSTFNDANGNGFADVGETITYGFKATNTGNVTLTNISITDALVSVSGSLASLAPGASDSTTFTATYTITQTDVDKGSVSNQATATGSNPAGESVTDLSDDPTDATNIDADGDGEPDDKTVTDFNDAPSSISLEKTGTFNDANGNGFADVGETITYGFKVTNTGNLTLTNISITDPLVSVSGSLATLAPGASDSTTFTATYTITQADVDNGSVTNQATVTGTDPEGTSVSDTSDDPSDATNVDDNRDGEPDDKTVTDFTDSPSSISLEKTSTFNDANGNGFADVGETITYGFKVTNIGNVTLTGISITDPLVSVTGSLASLAPGASDSTTFTATYTITQADVDKGSVTNQATVKGEDPAGDIVSDLSDDPTDATNVDANGDGEPDDATVTDFTDSPSSVSLEKTGTFNDANGNGFADAGETITYGFKVTNTGNVTLTGISISDALVSVTGSLASLAPGASDSRTFTSTYTITQSDIDSGSVTNQATVTGSNPAGDSVSDLSDDPTDATNVDANGDGEPDDKTVTDFSSSSSISLEKTSTFNDANGNGFADVGETITYGFKATNTGNVTLTNISISDALVSVTGSLASLAPGASDSTTFTATYTITQSDIDSGSVTNQATVNGTDPEGTSVSDLSDDPTDATNVDANGDGEPDDKTVTDFSSSSSILLEKTSTFNDANGNGFADVGETITYGFKVTNTGNLTLTNISISDALVSVTGSLASLAPGASDSTTFTATYTITQADIDSGSVTNQATVTGTDPEGTSVSDLSDDPTDATNVDANGDGEPDDATVTDFSSSSSMSLEKTGTFNDANGNGFADVGETITYGFKVTNTGNLTLTNISISDALVSVTGSLASLAPGASDSTTFTATYTITQADVDSGSVTNQATVTGTDPEGTSVSDLSDDPTDTTNLDANGDGEPDDATVTDFNDAPSSISLEKTSTFNDANGNGFADVNETITYGFKVTNTGNVTLTNISISDALVSVTGSLASLAPGASDSTTFTATYTITQADVDKGSVTNQATVKGEDPAGDLVSDLSDDPTDATNVDANGDGEPDDITVTNFNDAPSSISLEKTGTFSDANGNGFADAGETITYGFKVTNTGNVTLTNISISDALVSVTGSLASLAPGASDSSTFTATYTITQSDIDSGSEQIKQQ
ncbi:hypothetical protein [Formosa sp. L2A11]|uniref:DUF7507 domain-containing protein n=1 Tax=Formosa sp. L2A11 TaxID=2686363 RepID=UPI00131E1EC4|nr:hypothetical protein [Formosa sp. L2A11]